MKKILTVICIIAMSVTIVMAEEERNLQRQTELVQQNIVARKAYRDQVFEKRLGLTEVQKLKAKQIRQKGIEKLSPFIEQIKIKKQEAEMVRRSRMAVQMQEERLSAIDNEIKILKRQANAIKRANMKEFESILTRQQKKILKQMKKEGRQRYHSQHPTNIQKMLPSNNFGQRPQMQAK